MYKLKIKKSVKKRFFANKKGKIRKACSFKNHLLTKKKSSRKRNLKGTSEINRSNKHTIKLMLGI